MEVREYNGQKFRSVDLLYRPDSVRPKKVLLLAPNTKESIFDSRWVTAHLGVHRLRGYLASHGHECEVFDCNIPIDWELYRESGQTVEKEITFEEILKKKKWDIIGFSVLDATIEYDLAKIHQASRISPESLLIAGGSQATLNYQTLFDKSPLRLVFFIEAEMSLLRLCNDELWQNIPGLVFRNYAKALTGSDYWEINRFLPVESMYQRKYWKKTASLYDKPDFYDINTFRLFTMNYCPVNCSFCTLTALHSHATGQRATAVVGSDAAQVVWQCERVMLHEPDTKQIFFCDDDFFLVPKRTLDVCRAFIQAKSDEGLVVSKHLIGEAEHTSKETRVLRLPKELRFICLSNINRLDETTVPLAAQAGFRVLSCGVESTSLHTLQSINKPQTPEKIEHVTRLVLKHGIRPYYTLLLFTAYCNVQDMLIDLRGFRRLGSLGVGLSIEPYLFPLHGTVFHDLDVPQRFKVIQIEGTDRTVKKGTAWLPMDPVVGEIFRTWEFVYPRFKAIREREARVKHKEKNFQAYTILDCLEFVLKFFHGLDVAGCYPKYTEKQMQDLWQEILKETPKDTDSVGQIIELGDQKMKMKSVRDFAMKIYSGVQNPDCGLYIQPEPWTGAIRTVELPALPEDKDIALGDIDILAPKEETDAMSGIH